MRDNLDHHVGGKPEWLALGCLLFAGTIASAQQLQGPSSHAAAGPWSDRAEVAAYLDAISGDVLATTVGAYQEIDLDGDGRRELLAAADYSGRAFFNTLVVVWRDETPVRVQSIPVWNVTSLEGIARDLDGDGLQELLTPELLTPYLGVRPHAVWTAVHTIAPASAQTYVEASGSFPGFYEAEVLPELEERLARSAAGEGDENRLRVLTIERDKVVRTIGRDLTAGLLSALHWARESDAVSRVLAAAVLAEIDDPAAAEALGRLAADGDREVALYAGRAAEARAGSHR